MHGGRRDPSGSSHVDLVVGKGEILGFWYGIQSNGRREKKIIKKKKKKTIKEHLNIKSIIITIGGQYISFSQLNMQSIIFQCQKEKLKVLGNFSKLLVGIVSFNRSMS